MSLAASFGHFSGSSQGRRRLADIDLRVGGYDLDNTRFFDLSGFGPGFGPMRGLPLADDTKELRRQIWLATDSAYKQALDQFAKKRAVLQNRTRVEEVPDFSVEKPFRFTDDSAAGQLPDAGGVEEVVKDISAVFKGVPDIFSSNVQANLQLGTTWYVNSEGSSFTRRSPGVSVRALAGTQAVDGTELEDFVVAYGRRWEDLPNREELAGQVRGMAERLVRRRKAEFVERGLDFGIVARRLGNPQMTLSRERRFAFMLPEETGRSNVEPVTLAFKLFPDGRKELIRTAELLGLSESSFREIVAASETLTAYHATHRPQMGFTLSSLIFPSSGPMSSTVVSLVVPQLLFEDVTLKRPTEDVPHLPLIAHP